MAKNKIPNSRLMINYETKVDGVLKKKELPYRVLVVGDLSKGRSVDAKKEFIDRAVRRVNNGVDRALEDMNISFDFEAPNFVSKDPSNLKVNYRIQSVKDFKPDAVAKKVPEIGALLEMKEILASFAKNIENNRNLKKTIDMIFSDNNELEALKSKIPTLTNYTIKDSDDAEAVESQESSNQKTIEDK
ncbi:type VI secretion system contractile sheath small subunit [Francisella noatunensis]|uniref:Type VI secretion system contractile sheath small subunit n=2 Tax=Francisella noatunensis TaxID=657445 RepID=A0A9Q2QEE5_9GAMM|nr:type VI secretion system contractile sheath small subunit [Francisella noatunensis]ACA58078.1 IglA [Francisella noatunensis subsp. noatunensis]MBK2029429.1 type VI secretion system contractile sheath small subunit [Francisella noatunensis]MBK2034752.1 type VI secretion system contractile sheath small subunit [Francisella noatunensis]MBK2049394.1 type VI secretion system contractile sheath small subunit [Francisella noatunensis]MBK2050165.1 type VI secretion system contractile sheath small s